MLETGRYATVKEIAKAEKINPSYVSRVLRLTLLAPALVEALVQGRWSSTMTLHDLMKPFPIEWDRQSPLVRTTHRHSTPLYFTAPPMTEPILSRRGCRPTDKHDIFLSNCAYRLLPLSSCEFECLEDRLPLRDQPVETILPIGGLLAADVLIARSHVRDGRDFHSKQQRLAGRKHHQRVFDSSSSAAKLCGSVESVLEMGS